MKKIYEQEHWGDKKIHKKRTNVKRDYPASNKILLANKQIFYSSKRMLSK